MLLLWIGDTNCTWGTANRKTGKRSFFGGFKRFKTVEDRLWFLNNAVFYSNKRAYKCSDKTGRRFDLGCSVEQYNDGLNMLDCFVCDSDNVPSVN